MADISDADKLRQIADELRFLFSDTPLGRRQHPYNAISISRLIREAIGLGAFPGAEWARLRARSRAYKTVGTLGGEDFDALIAALWKGKTPGSIEEGKAYIVAEVEAAAAAAAARPDENAAKADQAGPWSKQDTPSRWGKKFGCSADTFIRRYEDGTIRAKKLSDRSYQVHVDDIPAPPSSAENRQK